ncbi:hypothetical protein SOVF_147000 isoform A [Spinacia oleracea]|nr:hypothetical protein SOVF_147000 isoform A [Spinacia oleracea]
MLHLEPEVDLRETCFHLFVIGLEESIKNSSRDMQHDIYVFVGV